MNGSQQSFKENRAISGGIVLLSKEMLILFKTL